MKKEVYYQGIAGKSWGIWSIKDNNWVRDIREDTPMLAVARLYQYLGYIAKDNNYDPRMLPDKRK